jgi:hypothetical protein
MANNIKKMLKAAEIGDTATVSKRKAKKGNRIGKQLKAKKARYSTSAL